MIDESISRERNRIASHEYYHNVRKKRLGIRDASELGRDEYGHFVQTHGKTRYRNQQLNKCGMGEHRKVWILHNGPIPDGYIIHHINGDKKDNRIENLSCITLLEHNRIHAHPAWNKGIKSPQISLSMMGHLVSKEQIKKDKETWKNKFIDSMIMLYAESKNGMKYNDIAKKHGLTVRQVSNRILKYKQCYKGENTTCQNAAELAKSGAGHADITGQSRTGTRASRKSLNRGNCTMPPKAHPPRSLNYA